MTKQNENVEAVKAELVVSEPRQMQTVVTPMDLLAKAMESNVDIERLEKLYALQKTYQDDEAKKAFVSAMAQFRALCPTVFRTRDGHNNKFAGLSETIDAVKDAMSECGLSHSWLTNQDDKQITVTCVMTHKQGHSESTSLAAAAETSGNKNSIQAVGSTVSYLKRYTFEAIAGIATRDKNDDDGAGSDVDPVEVITEDQWANLDTLISQAGGKDHKAFCVWAKIKDLSLLPAADYDKSVKKIEGQIKSRKEVN